MVNKDGKNILGIKGNFKIKRKGEKMIEIEQIINDLKKNIYINQLYIRGSFAGRKVNKNSDIDLLIISDNFNSTSHFIRKRLVKYMVQSVDKEIDAICLTSKEFIDIKKRRRFINEPMEIVYDNTNIDDKFFKMDS